MDPWQSNLFAIVLPLIPAANCAYLFESRWLFIGAIAGAVLGELFFSPTVTADFDLGATIRDRIISHTLDDLPTTLVGAILGGSLGYWLAPKHPTKRAN